jgi:hypothetical protein
MAMNNLRLADRGHTMRALSALSGLVLLLSACDGGARNPTSPSPTPTPTPTPTATYSLFGAVSEMTPSGAAPVEGARVADRTTGRVATTDANGLYSITGLSAMSRFVSITKDGYVTGTQTVTMTGDTQLDVRLDRIMNYILSGVVFEITAAGQVPIEGVQIYCDSCGSPVGHTFVLTDANGFYSLEWSINGVHPLFVTKTGYQIFDPTGTLRDGLGRISATVHGDTRFDIQLVKQ